MHIGSEELLHVQAFRRALGPGTKTVRRGKKQTKTGAGAGGGGREALQTSRREVKGSLPALSSHRYFTALQPCRQRLLLPPGRSSPTRRDGKGRVRLSAVREKELAEVSGCKSARDPAKHAPSAATAAAAAAGGVGSPPSKALLGGPGSGACVARAVPRAASRRASGQASGLPRSARRQPSVQGESPRQFLAWDPSQTEQRASKKWSPASVDGPEEDHAGHFPLPRWLRARQILPLTARVASWPGEKSPGPSIETECVEMAQTSPVFFFCRTN